MTTPVVGAIFRPQNPPEALFEAVAVADQSGLHQVWLWEDCFLEGGLTSAAAALAHTQNLVIGVGLVPVPLRNVAITAMEIATLERLFPGRLRVAVGHGVQEWMGQVGARVESPITLMREYLTALRALLRGERVTTHGRYVSLDAVALDWPPATAPRILMGAIGPKSLALAGECADGVLLDSDLTPERVRESLGFCTDARYAAGIDEPFEVAVYQRAYLGADADERIEAESKPGGVAAGVSNDPAAIARRIVELGDAGAQTVVLQPSDTRPDAAAYFRFVVEEVQPALRALD